MYMHLSLDYLHATCVPCRVREVGGVSTISLLENWAEFFKYQISSFLKTNKPANSMF